MAGVRVNAIGPGRYAVDITDRGGTTSHRVTVPDGLLDRLGVGDEDQERVVRESFAFLLEREPATSIMGEFELSVIARYFPEYEQELARRLA